MPARSFGKLSHLQVNLWGRGCQGKQLGETDSFTVAKSVEGNHLAQMVMDKSEAKKILTEQLEQYRKRSHSELTQLIDQTETLTVVGGSGTIYGLEFEVLWDHESGQDLRVMGSIDDGGWHALVPLTDDFIMRTDGSFVDE